MAANIVSLRLLYLYTLTDPDPSTQPPIDDVRRECPLRIILGSLFVLLSWLWTKMVRNESDLDKTLHFLLDHPRRYENYLHPLSVLF